MRRAFLRDVFFIVWGWLTVTSVVHAQTFFDVVVSNDYGSLFTAATVAAVFSIIRTGITLLSPSPVKQVWREVVGDQVVAFVAGGLAHLIVEVILAQQWMTLAPITRLAIVGIAGAARFSFFGWFADSTKRVTEAMTVRAVKVVERVSGYGSLR